MIKEKRKYGGLQCVMLTLLATAMALSCFTMKAHAESAPEKTREINIVYDDSGSMYGEDITYWSEAKYAVEIFAAMMGSGDVMKIFPMSDYRSPIVLKGSKDPNQNVRAVDNMNGSSGTPFGSVLTAADDLMDSDADDKWLVIFTDGGFNPDEDAENWEEKLLGYVGQNAVKVVYVTIGFDNPLINEKREGFFPYQAGYDPVKNRSTILERMTEIAARVFNYQSISLNGAGSGTVSFDADVPLSKIIVFAQGGGSDIGEITVDGSPIQDYTEHTVKAKVDQNTKVPSGYQNGELAFAPDLNGIVSSAAAKNDDRPFAGGKYSFLCNSDNVQVFVEPGVQVEATLRNADGERINLERDSSGTISEGEWTVEVQVIDPLTGKIVDTSQSQILNGAYLDVVVKTDDGTTREYSDGDEITVSGKELELYGRTQYQGISGLIEKTSKIHKFKIEKSPLRISFKSPGGFDLDAVMLETAQDRTFTVTAGSVPLTPEQVKKLKLKVNNTQGIEWQIEKVDDAGTFRLVPGYAGRKGLAAVTPGTVEVEISGSLKTKGEKREGTGKVKVNIRTNSEAGLILDLKMPEEQFFDSKDTAKYMFDSMKRGVPKANEENPYILVTVQVKDIRGTAAPMSEEEWNAGTDGFSFRADSIDPGLNWRLIRMFTIGGQNLDFTAVRGMEPSTYRLYLSGLNELNVLPNISDLQVELKIAYDNGAVLRGTENGIVTVKPVAWWRYVLYLMILSGVGIILLLVLIRELTKPRIPGDFKPEIVVLKSLAGTPQPPVQPRHFARFRRINRFSLTKPEMCAVRFDSADVNKIINFKVVATGNGQFRMGDLQLSNFLPVRHTVKFKQKLDYDKMAANQSESFETGDKIVYTRTIGVCEYKVTLTF